MVDVVHSQTVSEFRQIWTFLAQGEPGAYIPGSEVNESPQSEQQSQSVPTSLGLPLVSFPNDSVFITLQRLLVHHACDGHVGPQCVAPRVCPSYAVGPQQQIPWLLIHCRPYKGTFSFRQSRVVLNNARQITGIQPPDGGVYSTHNR